VARLDVAVDDVEILVVVDRPQGLDADVHRAPDLHLLARGLADQVLDGAAVNELHAEVVVVALSADVVNLDQVLVAELADDARLEHEAFAELVVADPLVVQHLEGHQPVHADLAGLEHAAQAAFAEGADDLVALELQVLLALAVLSQLLLGALDTEALLLGHQAVGEDDVLERAVFAKVGAGGLLGAALVKLLGGEQAVAHGKHAEVQGAATFPV